jgi:hypothetical protein
MSGRRRGFYFYSREWEKGRESDRRRMKDGYSRED